MSSLILINKSVCQTVLDPQQDTTHPFKPPQKRYTPLPLPPQFPGGRDSLTVFIKKHTRYPKAAKEHHIKGIVEVDFMMSKKGEVKDPRVLKPLGYGCDKEALRVTKLMHHWRPFMMGRDTVEMEYHVNIPFGDTTAKNP